MNNKTNGVQLIRSGGVAGLVQRYGCTLGQLEPAHISQLEQLLTAPKTPAPLNAIRDGFQYSITLQSPSQTWQCDLHEEQASDYAALLETIMRLHQEAKKP
jgi:hypothetical protein